MANITVIKLTAEPPTPFQGVDGDLAEFPGNGNVYRKTAGAWALINHYIGAAELAAVAAAKADVGHTHPPVPPDAHVHPISDVTGLQPALDAKAAAVHNHVAADVADLFAWYYTGPLPPPDSFGFDGQKMVVLTTTPKELWGKTGGSWTSEGPF